MFSNGKRILATVVIVLIALLGFLEAATNLVTEVLKALGSPVP